ncbi:MAG: Gfo/Idh/MocA family oxidoreductase [Nitrososphaerota archaeon]|nr:Gfo/Idh/MocA family oxidoreductase [Nitrososphaerota archaeon]
MKLAGVGLVGLGYWGMKYAQVLSCSRLGNLRIVCDGDTGRRFPDTRWVQFDSKLDSVLADPKTEAVIIATPASTHYQIAKSCPVAGKNVLVEKPLSKSRGNCRFGHSVTGSRRSLDDRSYLLSQTARSLFVKIDRKIPARQTPLWSRAGLG